MKILVTGGAGYIGSVCVLSLLKHGHEIVIFDNCSTGHIETAHLLVKHEKAEFIFGDLQRENEIDAVFDKHNFDAVVHLAAFSHVRESVENPSRYYTNNICGSLNLLDAMLRHDVKKMVFSSAATVYGDPQFVPITESHLRNPVNPCGKAKSIIEDAIYDYSKAFDLRGVCLRYFNVIGADSECRIGEWHEPETHLIPSILRSTFEGEKEFEIFGDDYPTKDHTCVRDYIDVEDLAEAHLLALKYLQDGGTTEAFNIGSNKGISVKEVLAACEKVTEREIKTSIKSRREGDIATLVANTNKAKNTLGWEPKRTLEESILSAYNWEKHVRSLERQDEVKIVLPTVGAFEIPRGHHWVAVHAGRTLAEIAEKDGVVDKENHDWLMKHALGDNSGENISDKFGLYGECTALYWTWKNYEQLGNPEFIGFMHYNKFFVFNDSYFEEKPKDIWHKGMCYIDENFMDESFLSNTKLNDLEIEAACRDYDILVTKSADLSMARKRNMSIREEYDQFVLGARVKDFDLMVDIIKRQYPRYGRHIDEYVNASHKALYQMFIMKREMFFEYCSFVFGVLFEIEKKVDFKDYKMEGRRSLEYLAEIMLTLFVKSMKKQGAKVKKLGVARIKYPYEKELMEKIKTFKFSTVREYLKCKISSKTDKNELHRERMYERSKILRTLLVDCIKLKLDFFLKRK